MLVFGILLLSIFLVLANGDHQSEIEEGKKLVGSEISYDKLNEEQLEAIGEYLMEQMHPGEAHELMHKMMGLKEGYEAERQFHINMAKTMYYDEDTGGMMGAGMMGMMPMMSMMTRNNIMDTGMMGNYPFAIGYWNFLNVLYAILLIGLIVLVFLGIVKLWKDLFRKKG